MHFSFGPHTSNAISYHLLIILISLCPLQTKGRGTIIKLLQEKKQNISLTVVILGKHFSFSVPERETIGCHQAGERTVKVWSTSLRGRQCPLCGKKNTESSVPLVKWLFGSENGILSITPIKMLQFDKCLKSFAQIKAQKRPNVGSAIPTLFCKINCIGEREGRRDREENRERRQL